VQSTVRPTSGVQTHVQAVQLVMSLQLQHSPSNGTICVRNHLQSVDIKIGCASCPMHSLATKPFTRQTSGNSRVIFFLGGNVFPNDGVSYQGLHLPTWAAESDINLPNLWLWRGCRPVKKEAVLTRLEF